MDFIALLALAIAVLSLAVALTQDRVQRMTEIHETLHAPELQRGRRKLYEAYDRGGGFGDLRINRLEDWNEINHALAMFNVLAYYWSRGWLPKWDVRFPVPRKVDAGLALWAPALSQIRNPALAFIEYRRETEGWSSDGERQLWPYLVRMVDAADSYVTT